MHTVVIVEPHPLFRLGLRQLLNDALPQLSIHGHDYSSMVKVAGQSPETCDLLLLSLSTGRSSEELLGAAIKSFDPSRILLLGDADDIFEGAAGLPECVAGCVPKEAPPEILQASVRLVLAGGRCFPSHTAKTLRGTAMSIAVPAKEPEVDPVRYEPARWSTQSAGASGSSNASAQSKGSAAALAAGNGGNANGAPPFRSTTNHTPGGLGSAIGMGSAAPIGNSAQSSKVAGEEAEDWEFGAPIKPGTAAYRESQLLGLTPRQYEVLVLLARGYPMKKVGRALNISVATAKAHTETLYQRLDVHNRNAAVYEAVSRGATLGWAHMMGGPSSDTGS